MISDFGLAQGIITDGNKEDERKDDAWACPIISGLPLKFRGEQTF
jgi:hypothetical protein